MRNGRHQFTGRFLLGVVALWLAAPSAFAAEIRHDDDLLGPLRMGSLLIIQRRTDVTYGMPESDPKEGCTEQALSQNGWVRARRIRLAFERRGILIDRVVSAPDCGSRQSAELVRGSDQVVVATALGDFCRAAGPAKAALGTLAATPTTGRSNQLVILPGCAFADLRRPDWPDCTATEEPGDALVVKAAGENYELVGCLSYDTLRSLQARAEIRRY